MFLDGYTREMIEKELRLVKKYAPEGALERILSATRGGEILGGDYRFCLLGHAAKNDSHLAEDISERVMQDLHEDGIILRAEILVISVESGQTAQSTKELQDLEKFVLDVINE